MEMKTVSMIVDSFVRNVARPALYVTLLIILMMLPLFAVNVIIPKMASAATIEAGDSPLAAGYRVDYTNTAGTSLDSVKGFWRVPTIQSTSSRTAVTESLGIGQYNPVVEVGTSQFSLTDGTILYNAYYYIEPESSETPVHITDLDHRVGPGTIVGAQITKGTGDIWSIIIESLAPDGTTGYFHTTVTHVAGKPTGDWLVQPVPSFQLANFTHAEFTSENATVNGVESRLDQLNNQQLTLIEQSSGCALANPSQMTPSTKDVFVVTYMRSAGPCVTQTVVQNANVNLAIPLAIGGILVAGVIIAIVSLVIVSTRKKNALIQTMAQQQFPTTALTPKEFCTKCGTSLKPNARFCDNCGQAVL